MTERRIYKRGGKLSFKKTTLITDPIRGDCFFFFKKEKLHAFYHREKSSLNLETQNLGQTLVHFFCCLLIHSIR